MEDEISKHTKKIYRIAKDRGHSAGEKAKEIIIEILIIVFAVSLSIWLHSWSEKRHEQQDVREFLTGLKEDITKDIQLLQKNRQIIIGLDSNYQYIINLIESGRTDTAYNKILHGKLYFSTTVTHPNIGRYDGFKSSGKIDNIENDSLKQHILVFYEQTVPDIAYAENYINGLQLKILDWDIDNSDKIQLIKFVATPKMQSYLYLGVYNFGVNISIYNDALGQANKIIAMIDEELRN